MGQDLDISQESILQNADEETVCSLNGCRVTDQVLCLIPNIQVVHINFKSFSVQLSVTSLSLIVSVSKVQNFCTTLRCMKFWAKHCGVY